MKIMILFRFIAGVALCATPVLFSCEMPVGDGVPRSKTLIKAIQDQLGWQQNAAQALYEGLEKINFDLRPEVNSPRKDSRDLTNLLDFLRAAKDELKKVPSRWAHKAAPDESDLQQVCALAKLSQDTAVRNNIPFKDAFSIFQESNMNISSEYSTQDINGRIDACVQQKIAAGQIQIVVPEIDTPGDTTADIPELLQTHWKNYWKVYLGVAVATSVLGALALAWFGYHKFYKKKTAQEPGPQASVAA